MCTISSEINNTGKRHSICGFRIYEKNGNLIYHTQFNRDGLKVKNREEKHVFPDTKEDEYGSQTPKTQGDGGLIDKRF